MKKKVLILGLATLALCGCGKIPKLSNGEDAIVTFKDNAISANEFYEEIKNAYGLQSLVNMIDKFIFEKEFADEKESAKKYAEAQIKALRANYSSEAELLSALSIYGYQTVEAYQNYIYISYLQNHAIETYVKNNITEEELKKYYETDVYPNMTISHILVTPDVKNSMSADEKKEEEKKAKETINKIIAELNKAKKNKEDVAEKFSALAKEYSDDSSTKNKGGNLGEINIGSLSTNYDELIKAAAKLQDGEYSTEVITTELGYHVILKTATGKKKSYDDSLDSMKEKITTKKLSEKKSLIPEAIKYYREKYEMDIIDDEIDAQYSKYMNNLINTYKD